ncbi:alpha/beta fold hydrolase [Acinetobacter modestus]|uniref:alpha/beta fold hydrolase n=1 Tax=Acinetobacter modestus TaxID=1776740 RepID=UPI001F4B2E54|nr:alpha/beta fold hydrolase [Acinetobacter modestus]MCH7387533.1 alpha/beta fold hydrolase [Acinetobacter modestus]
MNHFEKTKRYVHSGNICLAAYHWGHLDADRETIVLVHGYPDAADVWQLVAECLAADFNVVAYDVRGTGLSDIPETTQGYAFDYLVQDLSQVIQAMSPDQAIHLVGHDWGALQAWEAVLGDRLKPQIASYTALAPSADHVGWWFQRQLAQRNFQGYFNVAKRITASGYMAMFQIPILPELTWHLGLDKLWSTLVGYLENTTVEASSTQLRNAKSGLGLYRQNLVKPLLNPSRRRTSIPVQMLLMNQDPFVPLSLSRGMEEWVEDIRYAEVGAGHWGILSHPQPIAEKIQQFVQSISQLRSKQIA